MKKEKWQKILPSPTAQRFEPQIFEQKFPAQDLNFEGDQINRAHGS